MSTHRILHRFKVSQGPKAGCKGNLKRRLCYEVWEYDNYADDHFYCDVYMSRSTAYRAVHALEKQHLNDDYYDSWDYFWILELSIEDHNKMMKELGGKRDIIDLKKRHKE